MPSAHDLIDTDKGPHRALRTVLQKAGRNRIEEHPGSLVSEGDQLIERRDGVWIARSHCRGAAVETDSTLARFVGPIVRHADPTDARLRAICYGPTLDDNAYIVDITHYLGRRWFD